MRDPVVSVRIPKDKYAQLQDAAKSEGMTVSQYVRRAIRWALILR